MGEQAKSVASGRIGHGIARLFIALALIVAKASLCNADENLNAFQASCAQFQRIDDAFFATEAANQQSFWHNEAIRKTYLIALNQGGEAARHAVASSDDPDAARAAVLLVGIVRRDLSLVQMGYSAGALRYYDGVSAFTPLTMAASCEFAPGVKFFLDKGLNPNQGPDLGAFNVALVYQDTALERELLKAGYHIEANKKRCLSSKYILQRNSSAIPADVSAAIQSSVCPTSVAKDQ